MLQNLCPFEMLWRWAKPCTKILKKLRTVQLINQSSSTATWRISCNAPPRFDAMTICPRPRCPCTFFLDVSSLVLSVPWMMHPWPCFLTLNCIQAVQNHNSYSQKLEFTRTRTASICPVSGLSSTNLTDPNITQGWCVPDRCVPDRKFLDVAPLEQSVPWILCPWRMCPNPGPRHAWTAQSMGVASTKLG